MVCGADASTITRPPIVRRGKLCFVLAKHLPNESITAPKQNNKRSQFEIIEIVFFCDDETTKREGVNCAHRTHLVCVGDRVRADAKIQSVQYNLWNNKNPIMSIRSDAKWKNLKLEITIRVD